MGALVHGRNHGYSNRGCRCLRCTDAHRRYAAHWAGRCGYGCEWCGDIVLTDFPLALVAREAWPDDAEAIALMVPAP